MDPNRHHDYISNNEAMYMKRVGGVGSGGNSISNIGNNNNTGGSLIVDGGRTGGTIDDLRSQQRLQYYPQHNNIRNVVTNPTTKSTNCNSCTCNTSKTMCNGCRAASTTTTADINSWNIELPPPSCFDQKSVTDIRSNTIRQSPMYIHTNNNNNNNNTNNLNKNSIGNSNSKPYWPDEHLLNNTSISLDMHANRGKTSTIEPHYSYKSLQQSSHQPQHPQQHQQQQQRSISTGGQYGKERYYDGQYSLTTTPTNAKLLNYGSALAPHSQPHPTSAVAPATILYDSGECGQHLDSIITHRTIRSATASTDQQIVNPSNVLLAPKEQQPSPNYARKCPQIYVQTQNAETHNATTAHHHNLYMATPQFSSDKFQTHSSPQQPQHQLQHSSEYRAPPTPTSYGHGHNHNPSPSLPPPPTDPPTSLLRDSPMVSYQQLPSYAITPPQSSSSSNNKYVQHSSENMQHSPLTSYNSSVSSSNCNANVNYYKHNSTTPGLPASGIIVKPQSLIQHHPTSHYAARPYAQSPIHMISNQTPPTQFNYMKSEDDHYEPLTAATSTTTPTTNRNSIYINPYNTPPPSDGCCKETNTSPYNTALNYSGESPHGYPTKYGKLVQEQVAMSHKIVNLQQQNTQTPPPLPPAAPTLSSRTTTAKAAPTYFYGAPSPAVATVASPTPPPTQMHHGIYTPTPPPPPATQLQSQPAPSEASIVIQSISNQLPPPPPSQLQTSQHYMSTYQQQHRQQHRSTQDQQHMQHQYTHNIDPYAAPSTSQKVMGNNSIIQTCKQQQQQQQQQHLSTAAKSKSHITKPNYRELINEAYRKRNTTSEVELNMQIIKKTLNVDAHGGPVQIRTASDNTQKQSSSTILSNTHHHHISTSVVPLSGMPSHPTTTLIKQEVLDKPIAAHSPLDLSMRTVKTKADSTDYKYRQQKIALPILSSSNQSCHVTQLHSKTNSLNYKHGGLPRFDITPNFSAATAAAAAGSSTSAINIIGHGGSMTPPVNTMNSKRDEQRTVYTTSKTIASAVDGVASQFPQYPQYQTATTLQPPINSLVIKTAPKQAATIPMRPSVLETNPYAKSTTTITTAVGSNGGGVCGGSVKKQMAANKRHQLIACEQQLPPDTSIMPLPKLLAASTEPSPQPGQNRYNLTCVENSNFLGSKRHLQEYTSNNNTTAQDSSLMKQPRYQTPPKSPLRATIKSTAENIRSAEIPVIAINERAFELDRMRATNHHNNNKYTTYTPTIETPINSTIIVPTATKMSTICKQEPLTPTTITATDITDNIAVRISAATTTTASPAATVALVPIKVERIRTKAELKGFTFNTPTTPILELPKIKVEPLTPTNEHINTEEVLPSTATVEATTPDSLPSIPGLSDDFNESSLLDFGWNNACNNFVEQLRTNSNGKPQRQLQSPKEQHQQQQQQTSDIVIKKDLTLHIKQELSEDDLPVARILQHKYEKKFEFSSSAAEATAVTKHQLPTNKPLAESTTSYPTAQPTIGQCQSTAASRILSQHQQQQQQQQTQKKLSKLEREKKRLVQEQRIAARRRHRRHQQNHRSSDDSSESDNELDKRKNERQMKKPLLRKGKTKRPTEKETTVVTAPALAPPAISSDVGAIYTTTSDGGATVSTDLKSKLISSSGNLHKSDKETFNIKSKVELLKMATTSSTAFTVCNTKSTTLKNLELTTISGTERRKRQTTTTPSMPTTATITTSTSSLNNEREEDVEQKMKNQHNIKVQYNAGEKGKGNFKMSKIHHNNRLSAHNEQRLRLKNATAGKLHPLKIGLNTMTRSKRKKELEMQLANSKVLRNDKIIRNSTTKIKRKYVRKFANNNQNLLNNVKDSRSMTDASGIGGVGTMCTRLRTKSTMKSGNENVRQINGRRANKQINSNNSKVLQKHAASVYAASSNKSKMATGAATGRHQQQDNYLEYYRYKRALKVPPSLIHIKQPQHHKIAASLPDLERRSDTVDELLTATTTSIRKQKIKYKKDLSKLIDDSPISIIDLLHSRVVTNNVLRTATTSTPIAKASTVKVSPTQINASGSKSCSASVNTYSETSQNTETNSVCELSLPTPTLAALKKQQPQTQQTEDGELKRHFSIFDTKVLQTKTRTESKMQQKREIIREIFVGNDRPASAPPEVTQMSGGVAGADDVNSVDHNSLTVAGVGPMTYEEKYEQFREQMNIVLNENKLGKFGRISARQTLPIVIKREMGDDDDDEDDNNTEESASVSAIDADEKTEPHNLHDNVELMNAGTAPANFSRRRRPGKYLRRKGSSGFDYIRKKKKPAPATTSNNNNNSSNAILQAGSTNIAFDSHMAGMLHHNNHQPYPKIKIERFDDDSEKCFKIKTESDVSREIQKWVLNKGVGQSTMHKAARQGYIDVIVYCLDRLGMNPNQKDNAGYTPLHEACTHGWLEIARILLQFGAHHSEAAQAGIRPLHGAIENDHEEVVRLLLSYGADPLLATYSGQTPLMLASSKIMRGILSQHLSDAQKVGPDRTSMRFPGPWDIFDATEFGYDIFDNVPNFKCDMSRALRKSLVSNNERATNKKSTITTNQNGETLSSKTAMDKCAVVLDNIDRFNSVRLLSNDSKSEFLVENSNSDGDIFEFEEADVLLPPLYLLKDEGSDKWVLLNDLCNILKVKSKDTLLNKICPTSSSMASAHKSLMREFKTSDFLEKATCLQLLCAGEKLNIGASKVVLIKYNESVKNLLGVKTILMKF